MDVAMATQLMDAPENQAFEVFAAPSKRGLRDAELTLVALGIPHDITEWNGLWRLVVPASHAELALGELRTLVTENRNWPVKQAPAPLRSTGWKGALAYGLLILLMHPVGQVGFAGLNWWEPGKVDAGRIRAGELWRTATALTLHGDVAHLAANLAFGIGFGVLASHSLGAGLTWAATLLAGISGNLVNAWLSSHSFTAIGASTAVFGTLGVMSTFEWVRRKDLGLAPLRRAAPLIGGAVLLGFLGAGGGEDAARRVDVGGHVFGFLCGGVVGFVLGKLRAPARLNAGGQLAVGLASFAALAAAWAWALSAG